jgi:ribosomal protein S18 acetylase RimI-like enzyme
MHLRPLVPNDREPLVALLQRIDAFNAADIGVAVELIDETLKNPERSTYRFIVAVEESEGDEKTYFGYVCFGHTPMTRHTYDLYWIVVDPAHRGKGIGHELLRALTATLAHNGGRILRVETSSSEMYRAAKGFYKRAGFVEGGRIPNFYKDRDDLIIYYKAVEAADRD